MTQRLTQLLARYLSFALVALAGALGASEEEASTLAAHADAISAAVGAVGLAAIDLLIHRSGLGAILAPSAPSES